MRRRWFVKLLDSGNAKLPTLLRHGWEPFGVVQRSHSTVIALRKRGRA